MKFKFYKNFLFIILIGKLLCCQNIFSQNTFLNKDTNSTHPVYKQKIINPVQLGYEFWFPLKTFKEGKLLGIAGFMDINLWKDRVFFKLEPAFLFFTGAELSYTYLSLGCDYKLLDINGTHQVYAGFSLFGAIPSNDKDWFNVGPSLDIKYQLSFNENIGMTYGIRGLGFMFADKEHGFNPYFTIGIQVFH